MNARNELPGFSVPRNQWIRAWLQVDEFHVLQLSISLSQGLDVIPVRQAKDGLALLQMRDGALGECYYIGEIPLARAHVRLLSGSGIAVEGAAQVMSDNAALAQAMAILDAILANRLDGWEDAALLVEMGMRAAQAEALQRQAMREATRVNFSVLDAQREDDDE